jgi:hypothetical protein
MQFNLRSARRLEREIETEIQNLTMGVTAGNGLNVSIYEDFDATLASAQSTVVTNVEKAFRLADIRAKIRKAIETANEASGINSLMNEEALLRAKQKLLTNAMGPELTFSEVQVLRAKHAGLKATGPQSSNYGAVQDSIGVRHIMEKETLDLLKAQSKGIQRRLLKLVDELTSKNTTLEIKVEQVDIEFLEANSFVV